jgi:hypothetical protein
MKTTLKVLALSVMLGGPLLLSNCKKDDPEPAPAPVPPTDTEKLSNKNYKMTAATIDPAVEIAPGVFVSNWYAQIPACEKDDLIKFAAADKNSTSGAYTEDEGPSKCNTNDPQTTTGTWAWNTNKTIITINDGTDTFNFNVQQNDGTTLKGTIEEEIDGTVYTLNVTFTKQ